MGVDASKPATGSSSTPSSGPLSPGRAPYKVVADVRSPAFTVEVLRYIPGVPAVLSLRIDREALSVVDPDTGGVLRAWPYHRILCWGYTTSTFQWKMFHSKDGKSPTASGGSGSGSGSGGTSSGGGGSTAPDPAAALSINPPPAAARGRPDPGAALTPGGRDSRSPDVIAAMDATTALPSEADAATVETFIVLTPSGADIEAQVMGAVRRLMSDMAARGVADDEFATLLVTLRSLGDDGAAELALATVRQMALTRAFDVRQAVQLVDAIGEVSPFDKVEAAVTLYSSVMNKESYPLVLARFDDDGDRDNICHRLGIAVDAAGRIIAKNLKAAGGR